MHMSDAILPLLKLGLEGSFVKSASGVCEAGPTPGARDPWSGQSSQPWDCVVDRREAGGLRPGSRVGVCSYTQNNLN